MNWQLLRAGVQRPGRAWTVATALLKGQLCRVSCRLRGVRFQAGKNFRVHGSLSVRGPGRVVFGDNVRVEMYVTPWTYAADAVIRIGDDSFINGTRFGCKSAITVGRRAILADASIMDTDFHSVHADRHSADATCTGCGGYHWRKRVDSWQGGNPSRHDCRRQLGCRIRRRVFRGFPGELGDRGKSRARGEGCTWARRRLVS